jgi:hypothetical protein
VVPAGIIFPLPFAGVTVKPVSLHTVTVWLVTVAIGNTVTVMV